MADAEAKEADRAPILLLFDVDGTLTESRLTIQPSMVNLLKSVKPKVYLGLVGGSDYDKQQEQLAGMGGDGVMMCLYDPHTQYIHMNTYTFSALFFRFYVQRKWTLCVGEWQISKLALLKKGAK